MWERFIDLIVRLLGGLRRDKAHEAKEVEFKGGDAAADFSDSIDEQLRRADEAAARSRDRQAP